MRWKCGTCLECPPQWVAGDDELMAFSFCSDLWQHPQINEGAQTVSQAIQQLLQNLDLYLNHWKHYRPLWERNKAVIIEKFAAKDPSCVMYDNKLQFFYHIYQEAMLEPVFIIENSIYLNLEPLVQTVQEIAQSWISSLGSLLSMPAKEDLFNLRDTFMVLLPYSLSHIFFITIVL